MSVFYLVRHAEKSVAKDILPGRAPGVALSLRGQGQAENLGRWFSSRPVDRIYCSPLQRAWETAQPIARVKNLTPELNDAFNEVDLGLWTNQSIESLQRDPHWVRFNTFRSSTPIPEGESIFNVQMRFVSELFRLREVYPDSSIAIVSHAEPIRCALLYFLRLSLDHWSLLEVSEASISAVAFEDHQVRLLWLNREL